MDSLILVGKLDYAQLYRANQKLGHHLAVVFRSKETHDDAVRQLI